MKKLALVAMAFGLASPALAADLPNRQYAPPANDYYAPPVFTWSGLYVGLNGALGIGRFSSAGSQAFGSAFGGLGGGTIGYNYQSGSLLVGAEGDIDFGSISGSGSGFQHSSGNIQGLGTARVRFGYVYDRALFFVTGGYAGASLHGSVTDTAGAPNLFVDQSHYLNGYVLGAGVEFAVSNHVSVKGEYLFTGLSSNTFFSGTRDALTAGANISLIRAGLNYRF